MSRRRLSTWYVAAAAALAVGLPLAARSSALDWLNAVAAFGALYLAACAVAPRQLLGWRSGRRALRLLAMLVAVGAAAELLARSGSYHRTVQYERHGDLLFTPAPNQDALEKISFTPSHINNYGLRGVDLTPADLRKRIVLCLGDSITYGYGVGDDATYAAQLQALLDRTHPGEFAVLNGGVSAYPMTFVRQKFLYLWEQGIRPEFVVIGYSMNEGFLGHLVDSDAATKDAFARRVQLKNALRSLALYNLVVENWGIAYYEAMKDKLVPGTHVTDWQESDYDRQYDGTLQRLLDDLRARRVQPIFVLFSHLNSRTGEYRSDGFLQQQFAGFAARNQVPVLRADELFRAANGGPDIAPYFRDGCHLSARGGAALAAGVAALLAPPAAAPQQAGGPAAPAGSEQRS